MFPLFFISLLTSLVCLDFYFRKMYWSDWGASPKIEQANMDGTARTVLVSSGLSWVNSLALDFKNRLLYWCDAKLDKIERVDFQGNNRVLILDLSSNKDSHHPFGLALLEDTLFWTDWIKKSVHSYNMTSSLTDVLVQGMGRPMEIHIYDKSSTTSGGCPLEILLFSLLYKDKTTCNSESIQQQIPLLTISQLSEDSTFLIILATLRTLVKEASLKTVNLVSKTLRYFFQF